MNEILISHRWRCYDEETRQWDAKPRGRVSTTIQTGSSLSELVGPQFRNGVWRVGGNVLLFDSNIAQIELAEKLVRTAAARLTFMDATGLRLSKRHAFSNGYPTHTRGAFGWRGIDKVGHLDHKRFWYDPTTKSVVLTSEPYCHDPDITGTTIRHAEKHGLFAARSIGYAGPYGGPGTWLHLITDAGPDLLARIQGDIDRNLERLTTPPELIVETFAERVAA